MTPSRSQARLGVLLVALAASVALFLSVAGTSRARSTLGGDFAVEAVVTGLEEPWAVGFLPDGSLLITEREGRLLRFDKGVRTEISGVPEVVAIGQGGLLDILVPRDFARTREIFLSHSVAQAAGQGTALTRARLSDDGTRLEDVRRIFEMVPGSSGGRHFGSRIVEAPDGKLFLTVGERGEMDAAQDLRRENGSVLRLNRDGSIPPDNPFVGQPDARPAIWSWGHRNPQGAALDLDGGLLVAEHGAMGGDEINRIRKGANYGWPVIAYGRDYDGSKIGIGTEAPGMEQPEFYWDPSIAPSGLMVYSGRLWPEWRGDIFAGSLKFDYIARLDGAPLREVGQLRSPETIRVRDVREGPDGAIWFLSVGRGALYRLAPKDR